VVVVTSELGVLDSLPSCFPDLLASFERRLVGREQEPDLEEEPVFLRGALPSSQGWLFLYQMWLQRGLGME
jgi:hypothetical protein